MYPTDLLLLLISIIFFFFQAEDGIRDDLVTGVQTCALPICLTVLNAINSTFVCLFGNKIQTELFADDPRKKTAHRMLLPISCNHDSSDRCAGGRSKHCNDASKFGVGPRC